MYVNASSLIVNDGWTCFWTYKQWIANYSASMTTHTNATYRQAEIVFKVIQEYINQQNTYFHILN